eukprot:Hpha_TRINITY_DN15425_c3_g7::TRINITY_DN15425_c3_g7_i1::g.177140::m.177140
MSDLSPRKPAAEESQRPARPPLPGSQVRRGESGTRQGGMSNSRRTSTGNDQLRRSNSGARSNISLLPRKGSERSGGGGGGGAAGANNAGYAGGRRASERLRGALAAAKHVSGSRQWVVMLEEGVPMCDCPNGSHLGTAPHTALASQVGEVIVDAFGAQWIAIRLPDGGVGFTPLVIHRFTDTTEETLECWKSLDSWEERDGKTVVKGSSYMSPIPQPLPVVKSLQAMPSQGFLHGFQLQADKVQGEGFVARRGSEHALDWNATWQDLMEQPVEFTDVEAVAAWRNDVERLKQMFCDCAVQNAQIIVEEEAAIKGGSKQDGQAEKGRTIPPVGDLAGDHLYLQQGILFLVAHDAIGGGKVFTSTTARKAASLEVRHMSLVHQNRTPLLSPALCCTVTHLGTRVLCTALLPIKPATLLHGSTDGGRNFPCKARAGEAPKVYTDALNGLAQGLNLRPHPVGAQGITSILSADSQVYAGDDGRAYLTNVSRLMPCALPSTSLKDNDVGSWACRLLRPEALQRCDRRVSSDAFTDVAGGKAEDIAAQSHVAAIVTQEVRTRCVEAAAQAIGNIELPQDMAPPVSGHCGCCNRPVDGQICFAASLECDAYLCKDCYLLAWGTALDGGGDFEGVDAKLRTSFGKEHLRKLRGMQMVPSVADIMHHCGVNLRYLGVVYCALKADTAVTMQHHLQVEMIVRAAKNVLWGRLQKVAPGGSGAVRRAVAQTVRALLQPEGDLAEKFWANDLGPMLSSKYRLHMAFNTGELDRTLVFERLGTVAGLNVPLEALTALHVEDRLLVDALSPVPLVKTIQSPSPLPPGVLAKAVTDNKEELTAFWGEQLRGGRRRVAAHIAQLIKADEP